MLYKFIYKLKKPYVTMRVKLKSIKTFVPKLAQAD